MESLAVLAILLHGFGWALAALCVGVLVGYLCRDSVADWMERTGAIDYDGLDVADIATIEDARAELARRARERAAKSREAAEVARFDALAALAFYVPIWQGQWRDVALSRLRDSTISQLTALSGIGPRRARRIVDAGPSLDWEALRRICSGPVASLAVRCV